MLIGVIDSNSKTFVTGVGASIPLALFFKSSFERLMWDITLQFIRDHNVAPQWARIKVVNAMARTTMMVI